MRCSGSVPRNRSTASSLEKLTGNPDVELAGHLKVDLRFGTDGRGELYLLSKANGKIWKATGMRRL